MKDEWAPWGAPGTYQVLDAEIDSWAVVDGQKLAVFAQFPSVPPAVEAPVVILCHGLGGSHLGYAGLGRALASHGFAVLHPQFLDSLHRIRVEEELTSTGGGREAVREVMRPLLFDPAHWKSRLDRVRAVIDTLPGQSHLPLHLRPEGVTVAGHSYGAYTAQILLGARLSGAGRDIVVGSVPEVACAILLSPQGGGDRGLTETSWDEVTRPLLVVTATGDAGPHGEGLPWRREPFDRARSAMRHLAVVRGGDHYLGGIQMSEDDEMTAPAGFARDETVRRAVSATAVAFAAWVRGVTGAGEWLRSGPFPAQLDHCHVGPGL